LLVEPLPLVSDAAKIETNLAGPAIIIDNIVIEIVMEIARFLHLEYSLNIKHDSYICRRNQEFA